MTDTLSPLVSAYFRSLGSKGGTARAKKLSKERQREIARNAGIASGKARKKKLSEPA